MASTRTVQKVDTASFAVVLAQAGQPFLLPHDFADRLGWASFENASTAFRTCARARDACWHALLTPDGVVGAYCRKSWNVVQNSAIGHAPQLEWRPQRDQPLEAIASSSRPRHVATEDGDLEWALSHWHGTADGPSWKALASCEPWAYLRGTVPSSQAADMIEGTVFGALQDSGGFGPEPFKMSLYASRDGMQTNLHADQHSGFLVQVVGTKRVVMIDRKETRPLRCQNWGNSEAPVNRRSWHDDGVPDKCGWNLCPPFAGLNPREVEVGPGEALYIPKGVFHDVLSRGGETLGFVLRCSD